jgi:hypothetical protein
VNGSVSIHQNPLGGEALRAVAGDRIAMIEVSVVSGVEFYPSVVVETGGNLPIRSDGLYDGKVAIRDPQLPVGSSELNTVALREVMQDFSINADAGEAAWVVIGSLARGFLDRKRIGERVYADYCPVLSCLDVSALATTRITDNVVDLIATGPGTFGSGHFLTLDQDSQGVVLGPDGAVDS